MTLRCRPREGGDPYAAVNQWGRAAITETLVVMGPRLRGDDSGLVVLEKLSMLDYRPRGDEQKLRGDSTSAHLALTRSNSCTVACAIKPRVRRRSAWDRH